MGVSERVNQDEHILDAAPGWMSKTLALAAAYNVIWGITVILYPNAAFDWAGIARPIYPQIWQCVGMIVGVYGVAYGIAAFSPIRNWPIVLAGLLGKILGPIGFVLAVVERAFPIEWSWVVLLNDVIWWFPFTLILLASYRLNVVEERKSIPSLREAFESALTQDAVSVTELSHRSSVMLVFLRHFGCAFCREALADLAARRDDIEANGTRLVLVHMSQSDDEVSKIFAEFELIEVDRVSDPERRLYRAIGLERGGFRQFFGLRVLKRGWRAGILDGHGLGLPRTDSRQMPGVFLVRNSEVIRAFRHIHAGERPDYGSLSICQASNERMRRDLKTAARVQKTLLPKDLPPVAVGEFAWVVEPTDELAGDTLNVVQLDEDHVALYVLDVSGHGVSSALLSVTLNHWLSPDRGQSGLFTKGAGDSYRIVAPHEVAQKLNEQFPMDSETHQYFTLVYGILDTRTLEFRYVTAGHPCPIHVASGDDPRQLPGTGVPIGLLPGAEYKEHTVHLAAGDRLLLFSDGVLEAGDPEGREFGLDRMLETLRPSQSDDLESSVSLLLDRAKAWRAQAPYADDLSVLAFEAVHVPDGESGVALREEPLSAEAMELQSTLSLQR